MNKERQLALTATAELTFEAMKAAMKRIFGDSTSATRGSDADVSGAIGLDAVKQEDVFATEFRGERQYFKANKRTNPTAPAKGTNPLNKMGK